jgi:hypothetical protein
MEPERPIEIQAGTKNSANRRSRPTAACSVLPSLFQLTVKTEAQQQAAKKSIFIRSSIPKMMNTDHQRALLPIAEAWSLERCIYRREAQ